MYIRKFCSEGCWFTTFVHAGRSIFSSSDSAKPMCPGSIVLYLDIIGIYIYIYVSVCVCMFVGIYIYIYIERDIIHPKRRIKTLQDCGLT